MQQIDLYIYNRLKDVVISNDIYFTDKYRISNSGQVKGLFFVTGNKRKEYHIAVCNSIDNTLDKCFTLAHEIGHYELHRNTMKGNTLKKRKDIDTRVQEIEADVYAYKLCLRLALEYIIKK